MTPPDRLDPFSARVRLVARRSAFRDPTEVVETLLEDVARRTLAAGASVLGHIKCLVRTDGDAVFHANLTSLRGGARACGHTGGSALTLDIDLVVLAYGLDADVIRETVTAAVRGVGVETSSRWTVEPCTGLPMSHLNRV